MFSKYKLFNADMYIIFAQKNDEEEQNSNCQFVIIINCNFKTHVEKFIEMIIEHK